MKNLSQHRNACHTGLDKHTAQLFTLFGFANLMLVRGWLCIADNQVAP
ncbi:hypothetical protein NTGM5_440013 [Candidatus Nitrotoga sp. M5]|nr:hypothetical protein NTGM5_440013 [Candidatus Nitrotoga sp. M5]